MAESTGRNFYPTWGMYDGVCAQRDELAAEVERLQQERDAAQLDLNTAHADLEIVTGHRDALRSRVTQLETALRPFLDPFPSSIEYFAARDVARAALAAADVPEQEQP